MGFEDRRRHFSTIILYSGEIRRSWDKCKSSWGTGLNAGDLTRKEKNVEDRTAEKNVPVSRRNRQVLLGVKMPSPLIPAILYYQCYQYYNHSLVG